MCEGKLVPNHNKTQQSIKSVNNFRIVPYCKYHVKVAYALQWR